MVIPKNSKRGPINKKPAPAALVQSAIGTPVLDPAAHLAEHGHLLRGLPAKRSRISVNRLASDANSLLELVAPHREALLGAGLESKFLDELPNRIAIAQSAQTLRQMVRLAYSSDETAAIEKAMAHRNELMRICRFAFRNKKDLQETLTKLQEGTGLLDLLEDLRALRHLMATHSELVARTGVDVEANTNAAMAHEEALAPLDRKRTVRVKGGTAEVTMRNQAVVYALEALREVRDTAAFVFPKDEKLLAVLRGLGTETPATAKRNAKDGEEGEEGEDDDMDGQNPPTE